MKCTLWLATLGGMLLIIAACTSTHETSEPAVLHEEVEGSSPLVPHPGIVTDDPQGEDPSSALGGRGLHRVERFVGQQAPERRADRPARNVSLVGHLELEPSGIAVHGDVAGYKDLAFVGKWVGPCPAPASTSSTSPTRPIP
jgi:hypothetical protein